MKSSLLFLPFLPALASSAAPPLPAPTGLMCELLAHPELVEIADSRPELGWIVNSGEKDDRQTAYEIRLAAGPAGLGAKETCLWDSGKVASDQSAAVEYGGRALQSHRSYWWQVRTWNRRGRASGWSAPQQVRTGAVDAPAAGDRFTLVRYPLQRTAVAPVRVTEIEPGHVFLDFGRDAYAGLKLTFTSPGAGSAGRKAVVHLGETLEAPDRVGRKPGGSIRYERSELSLREGTHTYTVPLPARDARRMPPEIGPVMPFRYVEVENSPSRLDAGTAVQETVHYPFDEGAARFSSSDPRLDAVWELCRYSMKATSFCGVYVDGDRERLPYEADAYINQLGHYCADREYTLARYSHEYLIRHPTWPTEWPLHSVLMAWADYMHTGDRESLAAFYEDLKARSLRSLERPDGLISTVQPPVSREILASLHSNRIQDIVDWPAGERDGCEMRPVNTVVNAFHYRALVLLAQIAEALKKSDDARTFREDAERAARAINTKLFNPATGLYVDGEGSAHSALHAGMFPLAFGLVSPERMPKVAEFIRSKGMACSVYGAQYLMEALYRAGLAEHARKLLTAPGDRSWAHMLDVGTTITLEAWDNKYKPNQDWNHAWGAAPANVIPRLLMGVEPLEPGFRKIRIRPQPGGLERASLELPTVRGTVHVSFRSTPERFTLNVQVPANSTARVYLPRLGPSAAVTVDGARRSAPVEDGAFVLDGVGSGGHVLEVRR